MTYVVTFTDYTPSARFDALPWTHVRIEEAPTRDDEFTVLETKALTPVDPDPAHPMSRSFTTELATLAAGWYRVVFLDATLDEQPTDPVFNGPTYLPTVKRVATILRSLTTTEGGGEAGTFTADTDPTADQVMDHIVSAADHVAVKVGLTIRPELRRAAANVIALRAAIFVWLSSISEQATADTSPIEPLRELYDEEIAALVTAISAGAAGKPRAGAMRSPSRLETECREAEAAAAAEAAP
jgi:hypothetical protein